MKLVLVRHGTTDWNEAGRLMGRLDIALNERGVRQAEAAARALQGLQPDAIVASPQLRTQQTAATIAATTGTAVMIDDNLAEVWVGAWEGRPWAELQNDPDVAAYLSDPLYRCAAVEPCTAVRDRVVAAVTAWRQRAGDSATLVFVSHGDPLRILAAQCMGLDVAHFRRLEIAPGSLSVVDAPAGHPGRVLLLNFQPTDGAQRVLV
jgi:broad specificity phosphatase PhoE